MVDLFRKVGLINGLCEQLNAQMTHFTDSVYYPMNEAFQAHLYRKPGMFQLFPGDLDDLMDFTDGVTPDQYATGVVKEILKKSPAPWFWFGASSGTIRFIDAYLPRTFWVGHNCAFCFDSAIRLTVE